MYRPIIAAQNIKESFLDYITTSFQISNSVYAREFKQELQKEGAIAKGLFLDIGGSYKTGASLREMISQGNACGLFNTLEPVRESDREIPLERPLYLHQENALRQARNGNNLVITTGTGSGKTECFLIPIIDALLEEMQAGTLSTGVRAIIIYPMNALANDQMKRMRKLLGQCPAISFGIYNGNTRHRRRDALEDYRKTHQNEYGQTSEPIRNEILSREEMQAAPPHILITNYSMLEYMMLRPKDDAVFSGAKLRYIVLDEAHIYKGTTGMETSLLMRRLRARISAPEHVQYILTSATLGGKDANREIVEFADRLCGVSLSEDNIIRSTEQLPQMKTPQAFPPELFSKLMSPENRVDEVLSKYGADFAPGAGESAKLYEFCLHSELFDVLRKASRSPRTVRELMKELSRHTPMSKEQFSDFISVCARAEKDKTSLIKARYHFFLRALEGAFVTLSHPKRMFLNRQSATESHETPQAVFEVSVCSDCGRLALVGIHKNGFLQQHARQVNDRDTQYYLIRETGDGEMFEDADEQDGATTENDFSICPICGAMAHRTDVEFHRLCEHDPSQYVQLHKAKITDSGRARCPACDFGYYRRFYLGSDAATAVLGTELFEQLPREEVTQTVSAIPKGGSSIFARSQAPRTMAKPKARQFLCFSDSRSEAAFFAIYMDKSYKEFLRRRGIWHVAEQMKSQNRTSVSVREFVDELIRYFSDNETFVEWDTPDSRVHDNLYSESKSNAWVAILNEMYNARRSTSLVAMGIIAFEYTRNDDAVDRFAESFSLERSQARALLELLVLDGVYTGAITAGNEHRLSDAEREYIFFARMPKKLKLLKNTNEPGWISGWRGRKRENGNYYPNTKIERLIKALGTTPDEADNLLADYWEHIFAPEGEEFSLDACDFRIKLGGAVTFYRCKQCGKSTPYNIKNLCPSVKCTGELIAFDPLLELDGNHYANLYRSMQMNPLHIREHTAQLSRDQQTRYQQAFVGKRINALSCSTTFEMGVDVGSLETVFMRYVPPSPANYVQRAGRAGRSLNSAAFVLTYAKLSSHDFTYFNDPSAMIGGKIGAPIFEIENEKVIYRHIFAVAISRFLALNEDVYGGDDQTVLLNEGGYERLKEYLAQHPADVRQLLEKSIPKAAGHRLLGSDGFQWVDKLVGDDGVLEIAVQDFQENIREMEKNINACRRANDMEGAGEWSRSLRRYRCNKTDNSGKKV